MVGIKGAGSAGELSQHSPPQHIWPAADGQGASVSSLCYKRIAMFR